MDVRAPLPRDVPQSMDTMQQAMEAILQDHKARIRRLDAIIVRFDARRARQDWDEDNRRDV